MLFQAEAWFLGEHCTAIFVPGLTLKKMNIRFPGIELCYLREKGKLVFVFYTHGIKIYEGNENQMEIRDNILPLLHYLETHVTVHL